MTQQQEYFSCFSIIIKDFSILNRIFSFPVKVSAGHILDSPGPVEHVGGDGGPLAGQGDAALPLRPGQDIVLLHRI